MTAEQYIAENKRRLAAINAPYDQIDRKSTRLNSSHW